MLGGRAFVALVDARGPIDGRTPLATVETRELAPNDWVVIPAGVAHGFLALEPTRLLYLVTNEYDGSDELGFAWDDPAVGVPWPVGRARRRRAPDRVRARRRRTRRSPSWWRASAPRPRPGRDWRRRLPASRLISDGPASSGTLAALSVATFGARLSLYRGPSPSGAVLRKSAVSLVLTLIATLSVAAPSIAAVSSGAKVVIIVGATEGTTSAYRQDADEIYATAIQYTSNVVKVYSPNATWARVKAEVAGASVVIYLGHGNGWPSPYSIRRRSTRPRTASG